MNAKSPETTPDESQLPEGFENLSPEIKQLYHELLTQNTPGKRSGSSFLNKLFGPDKTAIQAKEDYKNY